MATEIFKAILAVHVDFIDCLILLIWAILEKYSGGLDEEPWENR